MAEKAFIVEAVRTAGGKRDGRLSLWHPADLGAKVLDEIVSRLDMDPELVDDVIFGCVDQVGAQSGNIARNAVLSSSFPESVPGTSVDRQWFFATSNSFCYSSSNVWYTGYRHRWWS